MKIKDGFILRTMGDNHLVVPVGAMTVDFRCIITLNGTGAFLWQQLSEDMDEGQLAAALLAEYEVTEEQAVKDVAAFIDKLRQADLLI